MIELSFHEVENERKHKLVPFEMSKNSWDGSFTDSLHYQHKVFDLLTYKKPYLLIFKLNAILRKHDSKLECRRNFNSFGSQNVLMKFNHGCEKQEITANKTLNDSLPY